MHRYCVRAVPTGLCGDDEPRWELHIDAPDYKGCTQASSVTDILRVAKEYVSFDLEVPVETVGVSLTFDFDAYYDTLEN